MLRYVVVCLGVTATVAAGCGDDDRDGVTSRVAAEPSAIAEPARDDANVASERTRRKRGTKIKAIGSQFGTILGDRRGQAVYFFDKEQSRESQCYGDCARAWPPVLTRGRPVAGTGAHKRLLGTTRRRGGRRQVTYRGRPLYFYVDDAPGRVLCHNVEEFGGLWLVGKPDGTPVA